MIEFNNIVHLTNQDISGGIDKHVTIADKAHWDDVYSQFGSLSSDIFLISMPANALSIITSGVNPSFYTPITPTIEGNLQGIDAYVGLLSTEIFNTSADVFDICAFVISHSGILTAEVMANSGNILVLSAEISGNQEDIQDLSGEWIIIDQAPLEFIPDGYNRTNNTLSGHLDGISDQLKTLSGELGQEGTDFTVLSAAVDQNTADIQTISGDVIDNDNDITNISGDVIDNQTDITNISGDVIDNDNDITYLSGQVSGNANNINTVSGDVIDNRNDINTLSADVSGNAGDIESLSGEWINFDESPIAFVPSNYIRTDNTLSGHLDGIDKSLATSKGVSGNSPSGSVYPGKKNQKYFDTDNNYLYVCIEDDYWVRCTANTF